MKKELKFEDLYVGQRVCDKDGIVGVITNCSDIHNITVKSDNSDFENLYCLDPKCNEDEDFYDPLFEIVEN